MSAPSYTDRVDEAFRWAAAGNRDAFAVWMRMVELPLRRSLARYARAVDVEVVVQETLLRMWLVAQDRARVLEGENASLRFAFKVGRIVALQEIRRFRRETPVDLEVLETLPEGQVQPELPDPALGRAISECFKKLPDKPRKAIKARIDEGHRPDRDLAQSLSMRLNTFLQNVVRARSLLAKCLERRGVRLGEVSP
jgi:RNA polymerase sigma-70 factor (ECF subfamily)